MSLEFTFTCPLPNGFHARPASHLAAAAKNFSAECTLTNLRNSSIADMKSVLSIIAADIRQDDPCCVRLQGSDEAAAFAALQRFVQTELALHDAPLPDLFKRDVQRELPRALRLAGVHACFGRAASRGIDKGVAVVADEVELKAELFTKSNLDPDREQQQINQAIAAVRERMQTKLLEQLSAAESGILQAHLAILSDASLTARMLERVADGDSAAQAIVEANAFFGDRLRRSENLLLRERAVDIHGICVELLEQVSDIRPTDAVKLRGPSVVIAENLTPQQLMALERRWIRGLVLESAGTTSHTVILARSLAIPTLVAVHDARTVPPGTEILVDANRGLLILDCTPPVSRFYERERRTVERRNAVLARYGAKAAHTSDGHAIAVATNVASQEEVNVAFQTGAAGVGVFRTEMLFLRREQAPTEEEQFEIYAQAAGLAQDKDKPVVIRTLDIGGDKPLRFLKMPAEENPFLGYRGVRIYEGNQELLHTQLRAILRASAIGHIHLLVPMISTLEEVLWFKEQVAQVRRELEDREIAFDRTMPVGTMIEVPSTAFILNQLCPELDFFSIGTNDLSQYFFAADRGNPRVANLANVRHPAFLRLLQRIIADVRGHGKPVSVCGDMAADLRNLPLLIGLGVTEISVPVSEVALIKERMARLYMPDCRKLLSEALACRRADDVEQLLDSEPAGASRALVTRELILIGGDIANKEEAIREIVDALYLDGRTDDPDHLEDVVWARESLYSTGLGHGFAVPHCKTDAVSVGSLVVLKLKEPVEWGSVDGYPVRMVIFLAARESTEGNEHLRTFSRLARNLMDDEFRERLMAADNPESILARLTE